MRTAATLTLLLQNFVHTKFHDFRVLNKKILQKLILWKEKRAQKLKSQDLLPYYKDKKKQYMSYKSCE